MEKVRVRFAPSPTGYFHVGNARTALFNWLFARQKKGAFILRIEDTDIERSAEKYGKQLMDNLRWLGIDWDEGPDKGGETGPYRQSLRLNIYNSYTQQLLEEGRAYFCFCSPEKLERERKKALAQGKMPIYSGRCRSIPLQEAKKRINAGEKAGVRLLTPDQGEVGYQDLIRGNLCFDLKFIGDPILVRSNGLPAYNYAVVIDDHLMKITHVIRGEDHISNTARQLLIYQALSWSVPQFAHLSLVLGKDNTRLSKRHGATSVSQFKKEGILPLSLFNYLALLGWAPPEGKEVLTKEALIKLFDLKRVSRSAAIFDYDKLYWINREQIKKLTPRKQAELAFPYLKEAGFLPSSMSKQQWKWLEKAVGEMLEGVNTFSELPPKFSIFFKFQPSAMDQEAREIVQSETGGKVIRVFWEKISKTSFFNYQTFITMTEEIKKETGCKGKNLYHPLRVALTARASGLELDQFIPLVEEGSRVAFSQPIKSCSQRVAEMMEYLKL